MARLLGISRSGIHGMIERGRIPHYRLGAKVWLSERAVMADMRRQAADRTRGHIRKIPTPALFDELRRRQGHDKQMKLEV